MASIALSKVVQVPGSFDLALFRSSVLMGILSFLPLSGLKSNTKPTHCRIFFSSAGTSLYCCSMDPLRPGSCASTDRVGWRAAPPVSVVVSFLPRSSLFSAMCTAFLAPLCAVLIYLAGKGPPALRLPSMPPSCPMVGAFYWFPLQVRSPLALSFVPPKRYQFCPLAVMLAFPAFLRPPSVCSRLIYTYRARPRQAGRRPPII
ncbi:MAG: hypothetical protein BWY65_02002 [Firmicutes bacterium ADurb.Bin373]|nr:MAG: hypothetical protein BWY65_02002 [Firmicutes bacterium ADurb.Bin373]